MKANFRERELSRIERSGWVANIRIRALTDEAGLPSPRDALDDYMSGERWDQAEHAEAKLRERFGGFRFAEAVTYGVLVVPSPRLLDTRGGIESDVRESQQEGLLADFVDPALDGGVDVCDESLAWTPFVSIVGEYGISAGSYKDITSSADRFDLDGFDTRRLMTRQLWGARLLQSPPGTIPDSDYNGTWTFTLFPGEALANGQIASGTVLKNTVRFRLGKTNRGIGSARISPALPIT